MPLTSDQAIQQLETRGWTARKLDRGYVVLDDRGVIVTKGDKLRALPGIADAVERAVADDQERRDRQAEKRGRKLLLALEQGYTFRSFHLLDPESNPVRWFRPVRDGVDLNEIDYPTALEAIKAGRGGSL